MRRWVVALAVLGSGCSGGGGSGGSDSTSSATSDDDGSAGSEAGPTGGDDAPTSGSGGETGTAGEAGSNDGSTAGDGDTGTGSTSAAATSGTGGDTHVLCSLADLDPTTDPSGVIDYGEGAGQIPTAIGEALLRNCGCHYTDKIDGLTDYISNPTLLSTWDSFHEPFDGVFPQSFDGPVWEACEVRVVFKEPLPMPPKECGVEGEDGEMSMADLVLFAQWFEAGAPDGASWPP